ATSSEELSGQAEILSEQIAYFRVDKNSETHTNKKIVDKVENKEKKKNSISTEQTTTKEQANSKGVDLEMYDNDNKLDDEFEKF
ncbi:MAG: hypothetical protein PF487_00615, partial [Bacteroidales bacterium]|nr:hypothetical protein [Bacteroidales bacterium]